VLSDPQKRAIYDQFGEGLQRQMPPSGPCGSSSFFSSGAGPGGFQFNPRNADDIFADFLGFSGMGNGRDIGGGSSFSGSTFSDHFLRTAFGGDAGPQWRHKAAPIEKRLAVSLGDLYTGATKKMKISREISDGIGYDLNFELLLYLNLLGCPWTAFR
jgi:DnaJ homolog subfamily B member 4